MPTGADSNWRTRTRASQCARVATHLSRDRADEHDIEVPAQVRVLVGTTERKRREGGE